MLETHSTSPGRMWCSPASIHSAPCNCSLVALYPRPTLTILPVLLSTTIVAGTGAVCSNRTTFFEVNARKWDVMVQGKGASQEQRAVPLSSFSTQNQITVFTRDGIYCVSNATQGFDGLLNKCMFYIVVCYPESESND